MNLHDEKALKLEDQLCFPLYAASREIIKAYRPSLEPLGLTYTQYLTMMVIWEERSVSVGELGRRLHLDSGTLTPVLKSLETKALVKRRRSKADERVLIAELTPEGEALESEAASVPAQMSGCLRLSPEEREDLRRLLYRLLEG